MNVGEKRKSSGSNSDQVNKKFKGENSAPKDGPQGGHKFNNNNNKQGGGFNKQGGGFNKQGGGFHKQGGNNFNQNRVTLF